VRGGPRRALEGARGRGGARGASREALAAEVCAALAAAGFNRMAIGVQSLDDRLLRRLGRVHDARQAEAAVRAARGSAIRSVGVDLILGLPGQDPEEALSGIARCAALAIDHVSLYLLEVHAGTRLFTDR